MISKQIIPLLAFTCPFPCSISCFIFDIPAGFFVRHIPIILNTRYSKLPSIQGKKSDLKNMMKKVDLLGQSGNFVPHLTPPPSLYYYYSRITTTLYKGLPMIK